MATIAVVHVREKGWDSLTSGVSKKGLTRRDGASSGRLTNSSLSSSLPTNSVPANSILPTRILTTLHGPVFTKHELPKYTPTTPQGLVLTQHDLLTCTLATLRCPVLIQHEVPDRVLTALPIDVLAEHAHATRILAWPRTYPDDSERPGFFTGVAALDHKIGSLPKAALTQVCVPRSMSSGKTAILSSLLAQVTGTEEVCALIDAGGCFNPGSAATAGVDLSRLLWVRCGKKMKAGSAEKSAAAPGAMAGPHATAAASDPTIHPHATIGSRVTIRPQATNGLHAMTGPDATIGSRGTNRPRTAIAPCSITDRGTTTNFCQATNYQPTRDNHATNRNHSTTGNNRIATPNFLGADARRMQPVEQAFKAADILIQNGGFGLIAIDLGEIEERLVRKIPLTTWFRFARVIERQPTALVVFATYPAAQSCAALTLHIKSASARWHTSAHSHAQFFSGLTCEVELGKARGRVRKPAQSAKAGFTAEPLWK